MRRGPTFPLKAWNRGWKVRTYSFNLVLTLASEALRLHDDNANEHTTSKRFPFNIFDIYGMYWVTNSFKRYSPLTESFRIRLAANYKSQFVPRDQVFRLFVLYCSLYINTKRVVSCQVHPYELFWRVLVCSSPNLRNYKFDVCGKRDS